jgi:hypothetical protein
MIFVKLGIFCMNSPQRVLMASWADETRHGELLLASELI